MDRKLELTLEVKQRGIRESTEAMKRLSDETRRAGNEAEKSSKTFDARSEAAKRLQSRERSQSVDREMRRLDRERVSRGEQSVLGPESGTLSSLFRGTRVGRFASKFAGAASVAGAPIALAGGLGAINVDEQRTFAQSLGATVNDAIGSIPLIGGLYQAGVAKSGRVIGAFSGRNQIPAELAKTQALD